MKMSDRFKKVSVTTGSDGMGGSLDNVYSIKPKVYVCQTINTSAEYVLKQFNIELVEPMLLITNELLDLNKDYVLIDEKIYAIKSVNNVKNKSINSYILQKEGDSIGS